MSLKSTIDSTLTVKEKKFFVKTIKFLFLFLFIAEPPSYLNTTSYNNPIFASEHSAFENPLYIEKGLAVSSKVADNDGVYV